MTDCNSNPNSTCDNSQVANEFNLFTELISQKLTTTNDKLLEVIGAYNDCCEETNGNLVLIVNKLRTVVGNASECCDEMLAKYADILNTLNSIINPAATTTTTVLSTTTTTEYTCYEYQIIIANTEQGLCDLINAGEIAWQHVFSSSSELDLGSTMFSDGCLTPLSGIWFTQTPFNKAYHLTQYDWPQQKGVIDIIDTGFYCHATTTTTTASGGTIYSDYFTVSDDANFICSDPEIRFYYKGIWGIGTVMYSDALCTNKLTGYSFIRRIGTIAVYQIGYATAIVGTYVKNCES